MKKKTGSSPVDQDSQSRAFENDELTEREEGTGRTSEGGTTAREKKMRDMEGIENKQTDDDIGYDRDVAWTDDDRKTDALFEQDDMISGRNEVPVLEDDNVKYDKSGEDTISPSSVVKKTDRMEKEREERKNNGK
ncbi:hypothetical protein [Planococcus lenghuensis]|uniref:Uncharacterized protein n=1 Tax=Planococcus lenghuensis TaxID=2213202 RepID=A0A1Q2KY64_9BACL|nr:hypothetical protein [Planococcus lenghuensis]AQQ53129.1 hypothetical protein B0X71_08490 [Planococcus lenghuensis]